ncbi:hypothetical protein D9615_009427 [Tricholomella constricta]|uniref:Uncharacterized protein n=1 Tax=Tricholomella constricta TaxID=117010 RepID=A0A8H5GZ47_9AGAR|nr:hypothetical protein D9615_009427 [Tricholomella constricta]
MQPLDSDPVRFDTNGERRLHPYAVEESMALCMASLKTAQTALNTVQASLQLRLALDKDTSAEATRRAQNSGVSDIVSEWDLPSSHPVSLREENSEPTKWYTVIVGRNPGVFCGPHGVMENVTGIPGGNPIRFATEELAREAYEQALRKGLVQKVEVNTTRTVLTG